MPYLTRYGSEAAKPIAAALQQPPDSTKPAILPLQNPKIATETKLPGKRIAFGPKFLFSTQYFSRQAQYFEERFLISR